MSDSKLLTLEQLQGFMELQGSLIAAFRRAFPEVTDLQFMIDAPKAGCVETTAGHWLFKKHGGGLAFRNWDGVTVDVHKHFGSPDVFDAWRITQYLESLSKLDDDDNHDDSDQIDHRQIESKLSDLASSGQLTHQAENLYRLAGEERLE